jgi:hypothetical protein
MIHGCRHAGIRDDKGMTLCQPHRIILGNQFGPQKVVVVTNRPEPAPRKPAPVDGTIYYLRSGGHIKIGWTSNLEKRMKAYPPDTQLLAVQPGTRSDERALHRKFSWLLTHGREWFPLAPQITEHIDRVIAEHGEPPTVEFAARKANRVVGRQRQYIGGPNRGALSAREVRG